ncbi:PEP-utilizing enzyme [Salipiger sp. H15]|uniref:PEP-utilizing enzyme n=1 Tax=Alloyangia sp. H15 TaxID=3029062 RepID=A0AAU8AG47_9RHOB
MNTLEESPKATGLARMAELGLDVPTFTVIKWQDLCDIAGGSNPINTLSARIDSALPPLRPSENYPVSIRSASLREGGEKSSATGHFKSFNGITNSVIAARAALEIWLDHQEITGGDPRCSVIIQETVCAAISGLLRIDGGNDFYAEAFPGSCRNITAGNVNPFVLNFVGKRWSVNLPQIGSREIFFADWRLFKEDGRYLPPGSSLIPTTWFPVSRVRLYHNTRDGELVVYGEPRATHREILEFIGERLTVLGAQISSAHTAVGLELEWAFDPNGRLRILQLKKISRTTKGHNKDGPVQILQPTASAVSSKEKCLLQGLAGSPGKLRGVIFHDDAPIGAGDVLFLYEASTANLERILSSSAIVSAKGGRLSHVASLCRELGKPCVTGIIHEFITGDEVEVDGTAGTVRILRR